MHGPAETAEANPRSSRELKSSRHSSREEAMPKGLCQLLESIAED